MNIIKLRDGGDGNVNKKGRPSSAKTLVFSNLVSMNNNSNFNSTMNNNEKIKRGAVLPPLSPPVFLQHPSNFYGYDIFKG
jgi:hypothetical protein